MRHASICIAPVSARGALIVIAAYSLAHSGAHAVTSNWNTDASGSFTTAANWDNGVPDSDDTAVFNRGFVAYTVTFPGNSFSSPPRQHVIDKLLVRTNEVGFADSPLFLQPPVVTVVATSSDSIIIGENAGDAAILNTTLSSLSGANVSIGVAAGATGTLNVGGTFNLSGALNVGESGTGTLNVANGGRVESVGSVLGLFANSSGHATVSGANSRLVSSNSLTIGDGGAGTLTIQSGGSVISNSGIIGLNANANGTVTVTGAGSTWTNRGVSLGSGGQGTLTIEDGGAIASSFGSSIFSGTVNVNGSSSTWTNDGDLGVGTTVHGAGRLNISNGGAVSNRAAYIGTGVNGFVSVDGLGSTWTLSGDLTVGGSGDFPFQIGHLIVSGGASVSVAGFLFIENSGGVGGNGTLSALFVTNRGLISPGLYPFSPISTGALQIDSDYLQFPTGKLDIQLGGNTPGTQYDQLQVTGNFTLSGALTVGLINSFMPSVGDQFDILDWDSRGGTFSTVNLPALVAGLSWDVSQLYTTGVLRVIAKDAFTADFDEDGDVDGADLTRWRNNFSTGTTHMQGDADGDGDVDGHDFLTWQRQLGSIPAVAAAAPVPEPATAMFYMTFGQTNPSTLAYDGVAAASIPEPTSVALASFALTALLTGARAVRKR